MGDNHGATCELEDSLFQSLQRFDVEVVGRFVEEQEVARLLQVLGHEHAVAFTARERRKLLLLGRTREVEKVRSKHGRSSCGRRQNHRRDDEGNSEFWVPEYQTNFMSKNVEHGK